MDTSVAGMNVNQLPMMLPGATFAEYDSEVLTPQRCRQSERGPNSNEVASYASAQSYGLSESAGFPAYHPQPGLESPEEQELPPLASSSSSSNSIPFNAYNQLAHESSEKPLIFDQSFPCHYDYSRRNIGPESTETKYEGFLPQNSALISPTSINYTTPFFYKTQEHTEVKIKSHLDRLQAWLQQPFANCTTPYGYYTTPEFGLAESVSSLGNNYRNFVTQCPISQISSPHPRLAEEGADVEKQTKPGYGDQLNEKTVSANQTSARNKIQQDEQQTPTYVNPPPGDLGLRNEAEGNKREPRGKGTDHKWRSKNPGHIKKPLNAFMLFMKEMRAQVIAECTLKESAAINQILGRKWHALSREAQAKYYDLARKEKELHQRLYPGWSARDNYATQIRRRNRALAASAISTNRDENHHLQSALHNQRFGQVWPMCSENTNFADRGRNFISGGFNSQFRLALPNYDFGIPFKERGMDLSPSVMNNSSSNSAFCTNFRQPDEHLQIQPNNDPFRHSEYPEIPCFSSDFVPPLSQADPIFVDGRCPDGRVVGTEFLPAGDNVHEQDESSPGADEHMNTTIGSGNTERNYTSPENGGRHELMAYRQNWGYDGRNLYHQSLLQSGISDIFGHAETPRFATCFSANPYSNTQMNPSQIVSESIQQQYAAGQSFSSLNHGSHHPTTSLVQRIDSSGTDLSQFRHTAVASRSPLDTDPLGRSGTRFGPELNESVPTIHYSDNGSSCSIMEKNLNGKTTELHTLPTGKYRTDSAYALECPDITNCEF